MREVAPYLFRFGFVQTAALAAAAALLAASPSLAAPAETTTRLSGPPGPTAKGKAAEFTATVAGGKGGSATGKVFFKENGETLGSSKLAIRGIGKPADTGGEHTCALAANGRVKCWGNNFEGSLGNGSFVDSPEPVQVQGLVSGVRDIDVGIRHACALMFNRSVQCWGWNALGQLGNGAQGNSADEGTPVKVRKLGRTVKDISAGYLHSCALTQTADTWCWGGALGNGSDTQSSLPAEVPDLAGRTIAITTGNTLTCAIVSAGSARSGGVKCFGRNEFGQLGNGTTDDSSSPVDVIRLNKRVVAISAGDNHVCALTDRGKVKCWGYNWAGQLGNGGTDDRDTPVRVTGLPGRVAAIRAGGSHTCALLEKGTVYCWGWNRYGQLGNNTTSQSSVPVQVTKLKARAVSISAGGRNSCAVTKGGKLMCWGNSTWGQVGNGKKGVLYILVPTNAVGFGSGKTTTYSAATFVTKKLSVGSHTIRAIYEGDAKHKSSASYLLKHKVK